MCKILGITALLLSAVSMNSRVQIKYDANGKLTVGNVVPYTFYPTTISGSTYLKDNSGHFFQIDITPAATRLASHCDQVVFYNTAQSRFNSIQVQNVYNYSDARAKKNIKNVMNGMGIIKQLRPVSYDFINASSAKTGGAGNEIGLLAQEVEEVLPNVVFTDDEGKKMINYTALIPLIIDAIKSMQKEIDLLKK